MRLRPFSEFRKLCWRLSQWNRRSRSRSMSKEASLQPRAIEARFSDLDRPTRCAVDLYGTAAGRSPPGHRPVVVRPPLRRTVPPGATKRPGDRRLEPPPPFAGPFCASSTRRPAPRVPLFGDVGAALDCELMAELNARCGEAASHAAAKTRASAARAPCRMKNTEQVLEIIGAGEGNRTLVFSLEGCCSTIELHPRLKRSPITPSGRPQLCRWAERRPLLS
jgi:hypothetical protein